MAKLEKLPTKEIIDGLAGTIDFYELHMTPISDKTIAVARVWPRYVPSHYPESSHKMNPHFRYIGKMWPYISDTIQQAYREMAYDSSLTGRDYMTRAYINKETV